MAIQCISVNRELSVSNGWASTVVLKGTVPEVEAWIADNYDKPLPSNRYLFPVQMNDDPWMDGDKVDASGLSISRRLTVTYGLMYYDLVPWPSYLTRPSHPKGTTLSFRTRFSGQFLTLPGKAFTVSRDDPKRVSHIKDPVTGRMIDNPVPSPLSVNSNTRIMIPLVDFVIEWGQITNVDSVNFAEFEGCVNEQEFLGCEPGTLLFEGADVDPSFTLNPRNPHAYKAIVTLKKRAIKSGGSIYGWNHDYEDNPAGWKLITMADNSPRYPENNYSNMFEYVPGVTG